MPKIEVECHGMIPRPRHENQNINFQNNLNQNHPNFYPRPFYANNYANRYRKNIIYNNMGGQMFGNMNNNNMMRNPGFPQFPNMYNHPYYQHQPNAQKVNLSLINNSNININVNYTNGNGLQPDNYIIKNNNQTNNPNKIMNRDKTNVTYSNFNNNNNNLKNNNATSNPLKRKNSNHFNDFEDLEKKIKNSRKKETMNSSLLIIIQNQT